jgi:hypothetical protein
LGVKSPDDQPKPAMSAPRTEAVGEPKVVAQAWRRSQAAAVPTEPATPQVSLASLEGPGTDIARSLIGGLTNAEPGQALSQARIALIRANLADLQAQGVAAIPAIQEYLAKNEDVSFGASAVKSPVGYAGLRGALFDTLRQIGGPEARGVLTETLRSTGEPGEIRQIAAHLEEMAPGEARQQVLAAAREALEMARKGELTGSDPGPLFDVLRKYGDSSILEELAASRSQWSHYASIALAGLPNGEGIPSIIAVARDESARKSVDYLFSFQLLAQNAVAQVTAGNGLLDLARENKIPPQAWTQVAQGLLSADTYQYGRPELTPGSGWKTFSVRAGEQRYYSEPLVAGRDAAMIQARLEYVDKLAAATSDPAAAKALAEARAALGEKLGGR